jgi:hypothetical protein
MSFIYVFTAYIFLHKVYGKFGKNNINKIDQLQILNGAVDETLSPPSI